MRPRDRRTKYVMLPAVLAITLVSATPARAHVRYVTDGAGESIPLRSFLRDVLSEPANVALLLGGGVFVLVVVAGYLRYRPFRREVVAMRATLREYTDLVPWLLRLSVGLPLVGAGFQGYFFSPAVPVELRVFQVALGFMLLFGFLTRLAAVVGLGAYLVGLAAEPDLLLASEFVGGLLAVSILGSGRPSADQLFQQLGMVEETRFTTLGPVTRLRGWLKQHIEPYEEFAPTVVRIGLGLNFVYLGFWEKLANAGRALLVVDKYDLTAVVPVAPELWVFGVGLVEITIGLALLVGLLTRGVAILAFSIFTVTLFAIPDEPVLAHVTLFGMVSALLITGGGRLGFDALLTGEVEDIETTAAGE